MYKALKSVQTIIIVKPFSPREVVLRVKALLRRSSATKYLETSPETNDVLVFPHLSIDKDAHRVMVHNTEVNLTPKDMSYFII